MVSVRVKIPQRRPAATRGFLKDTGAEPPFENRCEEGKNKGKAGF